MHRRILYLAFAVLFVGLVAIVPLMLIDLGADAQLGDRFQIIAAALTALALIIGALSFAVLMSVESADFKALQEFKSDLASLLTALNAIIVDEALAAGSRRARTDLGQEQALVRKILTSTTGFGLTALLREKSERAGNAPSEWRLLLVYLWEVASSTNRSKVVANAVKVVQLLRTVGASDLEFVSNYLADMHNGIVAFRRYQDADALVAAILKLYGDSRSLSGANDLLVKLKALQAASVQDADLDLFVAVIEGNDLAMKAALDAGADTSITDSALLRRYAAKLAELGFDQAA